MLTAGVSIYFQNQPSSDHECPQSERFVIWSTYVSLVTAEILFMIRTWAVWYCSQKIGLFLIVVATVLGVSSVVIMIIWTKGLRTLDTDALRCLDLPTSGHLVFVTYGLLILFYAVALLLMLIKAYKHLHESIGHSRFIRVVHGQSIQYYIYLFSFTLLSFFLNLTLSPMYRNLLAELQQVISSSLACRMLLELRASSAGGADTLESSLGRIDFRRTEESDAL
ncbi:hypothetical protein H2248_007148 [Termitomyces sp. 'cryptogamus']|nr:hypothetical protein H2248_007148 [Termitomyces sp. 'cryptogamus']